MGMKLFHLGPMLWLSKQRGCMQWQLVLFCPCGTVPVIPYSGVNALRHVVNGNQSSAQHVRWYHMSMVDCHI